MKKYSKKEPPVDKSAARIGTQKQLDSRGIKEIQAGQNEKL